MALVARQMGGVARAVLAFTVAVGLMGCGEHEIVTDNRGCQWVVQVSDRGTEGAYMGYGKPLTGPDGKPMCGAP